MNHEAILTLISTLYSQLAEEKKRSTELEEHLRGLLEQLKKEEEEQSDSASNGRIESGLSPDSIAKEKKDTPVSAAS